VATPPFEETRPKDYLLRLVSRDVQAADKVLGLSRVTSRAVSAGYLTEETAGQWLDQLARPPLFGSLTLFIVTAIAN
jgi:hypothetical protein